MTAMRVAFQKAGGCPFHSMAGKTSNSDVSALLARLLQNDQAAWRELVRDYSGLLLAIAGRTFAMYGFPAGLQDREDVVAAAWQNLLAGDRRIIRGCLARGFFLQTLHLLVRRRAIDLMRSRKIKTAPLDGIEPVAPIQDSALDAAYSGAVLRKAIAVLAPRERAVIGLFFLQGKSYREISALTGMVTNSIGPTIARALVKLKALLRKQLEPV